MCRAAASYTLTSTGTSTDSDPTLLSLRIQISSDQNRLSLDLFSLINPTVCLDPQSGTKPSAKSRSSSDRCRYTSACFLRCVVAMGSALIGYGAHVALVGNASGIRKSCIKSFINSIFVVQTNLMLHTLKPHRSHVENLRSVWSWSAETFEAHIHRQTDTQTDRDFLFL